MKKFIALAIAVLMLAALAVPAFAVAHTEGTDVTYTVGSSFTLTVPASLEIDGAAGTLTADVNILSTQVLAVEVVTDGKLNGTIENGFDVLVNDAEELEIEFAADGTASIKAVAAAGTPIEAGSYTGEITYNAAIVPAVE